MKQSKASMFAGSRARDVKSPWVVPLIYVATLLVAGWAFPSGAKVTGDQPELLEVEKAFPVTARLVGGRSVELRYSIASGYYLYRDRFRFVINGKPVQLDKNAWPGGLMKQDATFGKVTTYRKNVRLILPISPAIQALMANSAEPITLLATSQGCADAGVCYPPSRQTLVLAVGSSGWVNPETAAESAFSHNKSQARILEQLTNGK